MKHLHYLSLLEIYIRETLNNMTNRYLLCMTNLRIFFFSERKDIRIYNTDYYDEHSNFLSFIIPMYIVQISVRDYRLAEELELAKEFICER